MHSFYNSKSKSLYAFSWSHFLVSAIINLIFVSPEQRSGRDYAITFSVWLSGCPVGWLVVRMWHFG